jgi:dTDP-4-dehydrorhamnose 3,5-epimerase
VNKTGAQLFNPVRFEDLRGEFIETWSALGFPDVSWRRDNLSVSHQRVLRGIHGATNTIKLVSCIVGKAYVVVVSPDRSAVDYFILSESNRLRLLVPAGCGLGYYALTDVVYSYKQSTDYGEDEEFTWKWNDPALAIRWPDADPILSERDR